MEGSFPVAEGDIPWRPESLIKEVLYLGEISLHGLK